MEGETLGMVYLLQVDCSLSLIVGAGADSLPLDFHSSGPTEESKTLLQLTEASVFSSPEKVANSDVDLKKTCYLFKNCDEICNYLLGNIL